MAIAAIAITTINIRKSDRAIIVLQADLLPKCDE